MKIVRCDRCGAEHSLMNNPSANAYSADLLDWLTLTSEGLTPANVFEFCGGCASSFKEWLNAVAQPQ